MTIELIVYLSIAYAIAGLWTYHVSIVKSKLASSLWFVIWLMYLYWLIGCEKE